MEQACGWCLHRHTCEEAKPDAPCAWVPRRFEHDIGFLAEGGADAKTPPEGGD